MTYTELHQSYVERLIQAIGQDAPDAELCDRIERNINPPASLQLALEATVTEEPPQSEPLALPPACVDPEPVVHVTSVSVNDLPVPGWKPGLAPAEQGQLLLAYRIAQCLSQAELAARLGVSKPWISKRELKSSQADRQAAAQPSGPVKPEEVGHATGHGSVYYDKSNGRYKGSVHLASGWQYVSSQTAVDCRRRLDALIRGELDATEPDPSEEVKLPTEISGSLPPVEMIPEALIEDVGVALTEAGFVPDVLREPIVVIPFEATAAKLWLEETQQPKRTWMRQERFTEWVINYRREQGAFPTPHEWQRAAPTYTSVIRDVLSSKPNEECTINWLAEECERQLGTKPGSTTVDSLCCQLRDKRGDPVERVRPYVWTWRVQMLLHAV